MGFIMKGLKVIIGLIVFFAVIGAIFGNHNTSTPAATTSQPTDTKTAYTRDNVNFISKDRVDENIKAGVAKPGDYKEVQVLLSTVVVSGYAPDSGVSNQGEPSTPTQQQIQPSSSQAVTTEKTNAPSSTGVLNVESVKQMMPSGESNDIITVNAGSVYVTRKMAENLNAGMTLGSARMDTIDIFKALFKDSRVNSVKITSTTGFVDKYGQTSEGTGTIYTMTRGTYQKINWDNFLDDNLDQVSDYVYIHPAFLK